MVSFADRRTWPSGQNDTALSPLSDVIYASSQIEMPEQQWSDVHKISGSEGMGCLDARGAVQFRAS